MKPALVVATTSVKWELIIQVLVVNGNAVNVAISGLNKEKHMEKLLGFSILGLLMAGYLLVSCLERF